MKMEIELVEALCGFQRVVTHLDGRRLVVTSLPGQTISDGDIKLIRGEGMPIYGDPFSKGSLYIQFEVKFPDSNFASADQLKALEDLLPKRMEVEGAGEDAEELVLDDFDPVE